MDLALHVIPVKRDAYVLLAFHINFNLICLLQYRNEMGRMLLAYVLNPKIINY